MSVGTKMGTIHTRTPNGPLIRNVGATLQLFACIPIASSSQHPDHRLTLPRIHSALEPFYREAHRLTPPARTTQFRRLFALKAAKYLRTGIIGRNGPMGGPNAGKRTRSD